MHLLGGPPLLLLLVATTFGVTRGQSVTCASTPCQIATWNGVECVTESSCNKITDATCPGCSFVKSIEYSDSCGCSMKVADGSPYYTTIVDPATGLLVHINLYYVTFSVSDPCMYTLVNLFAVTLQHDSICPDAPEMCTTGGCQPPAPGQLVNWCLPESTCTDICTPCVDGICQPVPNCCHNTAECDDGLDYTIDACDPTSHTCSNVLRETRCHDATNCASKDGCDPAICTVEHWCEWRKCARPSDCASTPCDLVTWDGQTCHHGSACLLMSGTAGLIFMESVVASVGECRCYYRQSAEPATCIDPFPCPSPKVCYLGQCVFVGSVLSYGCNFIGVITPPGSMLQKPACANDPADCTLTNTCNLFPPVLQVPTCITTTKCTQPWMTGNCANSACTLFPGHCALNTDCPDDGHDFTAEYCNTTTHECKYTLSPTRCLDVSECPPPLSRCDEPVCTGDYECAVRECYDGLDYTDDICIDAQIGTCSNPAAEGRCLGDPDCVDPTMCTTMHCDLDTHYCVTDSHIECDESKAEYTSRDCSTGRCELTPLPERCEIAARDCSHKPCMIATSCDSEHYCQYESSCPSMMQCADSSCYPNDDECWTYSTACPNGDACMLTSVDCVSDLTRMAANSIDRCDFVARCPEGGRAYINTDGILCIWEFATECTTDAECQGIETPDRAYTADVCGNGHCASFALVTTFDACNTVLTNPLCGSISSKRNALRFDGFGLPDSWNIEMSCPTPDMKLSLTSMDSLYHDTSVIPYTCLEKTCTATGAAYTIKTCPGTNACVSGCCNAVNGGCGAAQPDPGCCNPEYPCAPSTNPCTPFTCTSTSNNAPGECVQSQWIEGCCDNNGMCFDNFPFTNNYCDIGGSNTCKYTINTPGRCVLTTDCHPEFWQQDANCLYTTCSYTTKLSYCSSSDDCTGAAWYQIGVCPDTTHICEYPPVSGYCDTPANCGVPDTCKTWACEGHVCTPQPSSDCCTGNPDCPSAPCIAGYCDDGDNKCFNVSRPAGWNCNPSNECLVGRCDGQGNCVIQNALENSPCTEDGDTCTSDLCIAGKCEHIDIQDCCNDKHVCSKVCFTGVCNAEFRCDYTAVDECCSQEIACNDNLDFTDDWCDAMNKCHFDLQENRCFGHGNCDPTKYCLIDTNTCVPRPDCTDQYDCTNDVFDPETLKCNHIGIPSCSLICHYDQVSVGSWPYQLCRPCQSGSDGQCAWMHADETLRCRDPICSDDECLPVTLPGPGCCSTSDNCPEQACRHHRCDSQNGLCSYFDRSEYSSMIKGPGACPDKFLYFFDLSIAYCVPSGMQGYYPKYCNNNADCYGLAVYPMIAYCDSYVYAVDTHLCYIDFDPLPIADAWLTESPCSRDCASDDDCKAAFDHHAQWEIVDTSCVAGKCSVSRTLTGNRVSCMTDSDCTDFDYTYDGESYVGRCLEGIGIPPITQCAAIPGIRETSISILASSSSISGVCVGGCDDGLDWTDDSCVDGACQYLPNVDGMCLEVARDCITPAPPCNTMECSVNHWCTPVYQCNEEQYCSNTLHTCEYTPDCIPDDTCEMSEFDTVSQKCKETWITGCCHLDSDCEEVSTYCAASGGGSQKRVTLTGTCKPGCRIGNDLMCEDGLDYTRDTCGSDHKCSHILQDNRCYDVSNCVPPPCWTVTCDDHTCNPVPITGCCVDDTGCGQEKYCLSGTCVPGCKIGVSDPMCDDTFEYTDDSCNATHQCQNILWRGRCRATIDCADDNCHSECIIPTCYQPTYSCAMTLKPGCCDEFYPCPPQHCMHSECTLDSRTCSYTPIEHCCATGLDCTVPGEYCKDSECVPGCDGYLNDCDDGKAYTADHCDYATAICVHEYAQNMCDDPSQCTLFSGDTCYYATCDTENTCHYWKHDGCCHTTADCGSGEYCSENMCIPGCDNNDGCHDGKEYTDDYCGEDNKCHHYFQTRRCETALDCDAYADTDTCTEMTCPTDPDVLTEYHWCVNKLVDGCCNADHLCSQDGAQLCYVNTCMDDKTCKPVRKTGCCTQDTECQTGYYCDAPPGQEGRCQIGCSDSTDCNDHLEYTTDSCVDGVCHFVPDTGRCRNDPADCPPLEDRCYQPTCVSTVCDKVLTTGCCNTLNTCPPPTNKPCYNALCSSDSMVAGACHDVRMTGCCKDGVPCESGMHCNSDGWCVPDILSSSHVVLESSSVMESSSIIVIPTTCVLNTDCNDHNNCTIDTCCMGKCLYNLPTYDMHVCNAEQAGIPKKLRKRCYDSNCMIYNCETKKFDPLPTTTVCMYMNFPFPGHCNGGYCMMDQGGNCQLKGTQWKCLAPDGTVYYVPV